MNLSPVRLEATFSQRPWGARSLAPFFPEKSNLADPIGEAWMTGADCRFATGPYAGKRLAEVWPGMPPEWTGASVARNAPFPILVKFIFAEEKLSVQVHPDDAYAAKHETLPDGATPRGKTEMWYAIQARAGAEVLAGFVPGTTRQSFERAIARGMTEECLRHVPLDAGNAIFVPAGTPHTIGAGLVLCEIQQLSDITYRVFDYNRRDAQGRSRELHIAKALEVLHFPGTSSQPGQEAAGGKIEPVRVQRGALTQTYFAACPYFATEKWEFAESVDRNTAPEHFDVLIFLEGSGEILWRDERAAYAPSQVWIFPAALGAYRIAPDSRSATSLLRTFVPPDLKEYARNLSEQGIHEADISRLVHR
ncbi:MAG TPA: type I phosphomannose isomerase catalytic subunit [Candidatus Acidoferrales bacterium]